MTLELAAMLDRMRPESGQVRIPQYGLAPTGSQQGMRLRRDGVDLEDFRTEA